MLGFHQTSHMVGHCLAISIDALRTTRWILTSESGGIRTPMTAHYPVLRMGIESASLAVWILMPEERSERVTRSLRARMEEMLQDNRLAQNATESDLGDSKTDLARKQRMRRQHAREMAPKKRHLRALAAEAGIPQDVVDRGLPGYGPMIAETGPAIGISGTHTRSLWNFISGLSHPSLRRSISASDVEMLDDASSSRALFTANWSMVALALDAAILARITALRLTAERGNNSTVAWSNDMESDVQL